MSTFWGISFAMTFETQSAGEYVYISLGPWKYLAILLRPKGKLIKHVFSSDTHDENINPISKVLVSTLSSETCCFLIRTPN